MYMGISIHNIHMGVSVWMFVCENKEEYITKENNDKKIKNRSKSKEPLH